MPILYIHLFLFFTQYCSFEIYPCSGVQLHVIHFHWRATFYCMSVPPTICWSTVLSVGPWVTASVLRSQTPWHVSPGHLGRQGLSTGPGGALLTSGQVRIRLHEAGPRTASQSGSAARCSREQGPQGQCSALSGKQDSDNLLGGCEVESRCGDC